MPVSSQSARRPRRSSRESARMPPSPWIGSIRIAAVSGPTAARDRVEVAERQVVEARQHRPEALDHLLRARRRDRAVAAAVEGALEGDDPVPLRLAGVVEVLARHLDRALDRLGARVGDEHRVGEGRRDQPLGQRLLVRDAVEVRGVPELPRLRLERRDERRVGVAEERHRDAGAEVEIALAALLGQPGALALDEGERRARVGREDGRDHGRRSSTPAQTERAPRRPRASGRPTVVAASRRGLSIRSRCAVGRPCHRAAPARMPGRRHAPALRDQPERTEPCPRCPGPTSVWRPCKAMWSEGKSASQIAKELGGVTRNAVIGKVHRLGLSNRGGGDRARRRGRRSTRSSSGRSPSARPRPRRRSPPPPRPRRQGRRSPPARPKPARPAGAAAARRPPRSAPRRWPTSPRSRRRRGGSP